MIDPEASRFWQTALQSGLVDADSLNLWWQSVPHEKRSVEKIDRYLARQAVETGKLTLWQAQQLLNGRWQGIKLGKYVLRTLIGQGGMGRVYLADDTRLGRQVAVKILSRKRNSILRSVARFEREVQISAQLEHENLIRVYDDGEAFGLRYLVMEYIDGKTVSRLVLEQGRLRPALAAELARQVLMGLQHLHEKGLLHRDVNPANILINQQGTAKLTDLGLALELDDPEVLTRDGATIGTFDYISPEQARNPRTIDIRSDIYSLGCTLYQMLTGQAPFPGLNASERIMAHQFTEIPPLSTMAPICPPGLAAAVHRMLRKVPDERYACPADAALAVAPFSEGPVPLNRMAAPRGADQKAISTASEEAALAAEWFDSDAGATSRPITPPFGSTPDSEDLFPVVEYASPKPVPTGPSAVWRWPAAGLVLALLILVLLGMLAAFRR